MNDSPKTEVTKVSDRSTSGSLGHKVFSFPVFLCMLLLVGTLAGRCLNIQASLPHSGTSSNIPFEGDTWWHIVTGNRILSTGHWPSVDTYSFTVNGNPWIAYEWVGEITMALSSRLAGLEGLMCLLLIMSGAFVSLLYYHAYQRCRNAMAAFLACLALLPLASSFFTLRPQMLGYIFLIVTLITLERFRLGYRKALWLLPGIFLIWVNTHGTFVFGFVMLAAYWMAGLVSFQFRYVHIKRWAQKQRQQLELTILLCLVASTITPYGTRLAAYPLAIALLPVTTLRTNSEFLPIRLSTLDGRLFFALLVLFVVYILVARPEFRAEEVAIFCFATYEAMDHVRVLLLFVSVFAPLLARAVGTWLPFDKNKQERPALNAILICIAFVFVLKLFPTKKQLGRAIANNFPAGAVAFMSQDGVPAPMFNEVTWGGYLTWTFHAKHPVFIDGREEIYDYAGVLHDYFRITNGGPRAFFLLRKYDVRSCLLSPGTKLVSALSSSPGWVEVFHGPISLIFVRRGGASTALIKGQNTIAFKLRGIDCPLGSKRLSAALITSRVLAGGNSPAENVLPGIARRVGKRRCSTISLPSAELFAFWQTAPFLPSAAGGSLLASRN